MIAIKERRDATTDPALATQLAEATIELLAACGMTVLISDYFEYYRLVAYLALRTEERISVVLGLPSVCELFDEKYATARRYPGEFCSRV